jgi:hypothetical protein
VNKTFTGELEDGFFEGANEVELDEHGVEQAGSA